MAEKARSEQKAVKIGGNIELSKPKLYSYFTDSGRSSLRLLVKCLTSDIKVLLPDYLCGAIVEVFNDEGIKIDFYEIDSDLRIKYDSVLGKEFDAFYFINYFGVEHDLAPLEKYFDSCLLIEDRVFQVLPKKSVSYPNWVGFNSFRKITPLADGSLIESTMALNSKLIANSEPPFSSIQYAAKSKKFNTLHCGFNESDHLELSRAAEKSLGFQNKIYKMSSRSYIELVLLLSTYDVEGKIRRRNYELLQNVFEEIEKKTVPVEYSFFTMQVERRDELREHLFGKDIFLPIFWPSAESQKNPVYKSVISIPVDSRYSEDEMRYIANEILKFQFSC